MLGLLGVVYVVALVFVWRERRRARTRPVAFVVDHLHADDRPPATAPLTPVPATWVGVYVEDGIEAISDYLADEGRGRT